MDKVTVLVDADPLVYRVGFSLEQRVWYTQWVDVQADGDVIHTAKFYNAAARDRFCELMNLHPDEVAHQLVPVPTSNEAIVYGRVKQSLRDIEQNVAEYLAVKGQEIGEFRLFLTGGGNFRETLATIKPYKGNRDRSTRPFWYKEIRTYLVDRWGAEVVEGMEADDAVSILQWNGEDGSTIICTIDKDLENVPGHFYNYHKKEARYISLPEATRNFYRQIIVGDASDNIPGCYKKGKGYAKAGIPDDMESEQDMWTVVLATYEQNLEQYPEYHAPHSDPREAAVENARLLWMLVDEGTMWIPPDEREET